MNVERSRSNATMQDVKTQVIVVGAQAPSGVEAVLMQASPTLELVFRDHMPRKLDMGGNAVVLAMETNPVHSLSADLEGGGAPEDALAHWIAAAEERLETYRGLRRRLVVVNEDALLRCDPVVIEALATRLAVQFESQGPAPAPAASTSEDNLTVLIAASLMGVSEQAQDLSNELAAMQLGAADGMLAEIGNAWAGVLALRSRAEDTSARTKLQAELDAIRLESDALRATIRDLHQEHDRLTGTQNVIIAERDRALTERDHLRQSLTDLLTEAEAHLSTLKARDAEHAVLQQEAAQAVVLRADIVALQGQLAGRSDLARLRDAVLGDQILGLAREVALVERDGEAIASALRQEVEDLNRRNAELLEAARLARDEVERIFASKSWRITEPLRGFRRAIDKSES